MTTKTAGLKKLIFSTTINATKNKVWQILWDKETYKVWTSAFSEGSTAVSDWEEGSKIVFLDGKGSGMYSIIDKKIPGELMIFRHIGEIKDNIEIPVDDKTKGWSGSLEEYKLKEANGATALTLEMDVIENFLDYMNKTFPLALQKLKELSENSVLITIETTINAPIEKIWHYWSAPEHITNWCNASEDWHTPRAENDLKVGGKFLTRMEAKDGSFGFDFSGIYDTVKTNKQIAYTMDDGRKVNINFNETGNETRIVQTFEAETENSLEMQRFGWQQILNNFKKYVEVN